MSNETSNSLSQHQMDISEVSIALKAVGKYLMRAFSRGHEPMYDAVLTISSVGVQIPLFFLTSVSDSYSTTILSNNKNGLNVKNHHYTQEQSLTISADITSIRTIDEPNPKYHPNDPNNTEPKTIDKDIDTKTSEHNILRAVGVLATVLNLAHNYDDLDGVLSSAPSIGMHKTNFSNPFSYEPASDTAIFRIFIDVIMQQGLLVDFESPTKVYKNLMITNIVTAPKENVLGVSSVTLTLEQTNIQDIEYL